MGRQAAIYLLVAVLTIVDLPLSAALAGRSAMAQVGQCAPLPAGLVSWWPGDGDSTDRYGVNHGAPQGGVGFSSGVVGQTFSLDGVDDFINVPDSPLLDAIT